MSQVDDWSDGYTSDYLRDLNTYGPASANVPRSSVVSHQVRYRAPDTSDIPLAPGQNPEGSVYSNASGARMGQTKPRSGYNPPAGGGYTAQTFPSSGAGAKRYARPKKPVKRQAQPVKNRAQPVKKQAQNYGSYRDLSDPLSQHILANGSPEPKPPVESAVSRAQDITDQSDMYRAIAGLSSPPSANDSQSEVRASVPETNFNRGLMGGVGRQVEAISKPAPEPFSAEGQFKNMPWYEDAKAHYEAVKKNMDDYGSALGMLKSTWDDIPWWAMMDPAGAPARAAAAAAAAEGRRLYGPVAESLLAPKGPLTGGARTTLTSADEGLPVGYSILRNPPKADTSALAGQTSNLVQQLRAAGIPEDQIAASIARINAEAAGREAAAAGGQAAGREAAAGAGRAGEAAADGGVSELTNAGNVGRETAAGGAAARQGVGEAAGALAPQLQRDLSAVRQKVLSEGDSFERIRDVLRTSGGRQELLPANIREACEPLRRIVEQGGGAALTPAEREAVQLYSSFTAAGREAAAAGGQAAGREAAAGAGRAGEAAGGAPKTGAGEAAGTLSARDRQQYRNYINMVQNDPDLADLVLPTLDRVGGAGRSIDSLSDAELSEFYNALNDAVNGRWVAEAFMAEL